MMVMHVPVKFEFNWTKRFRVKSPETKMWTDGWTEKWTNGQENGQRNIRNYPNFERNLAMMVIYVPVMYEFNWTNCF